MWRGLRIIWRGSIHHMEGVYAWLVMSIRLIMAQKPLVCGTYTCHLCVASHCEGERHITAYLILPNSWPTRSPSILSSRRPTIVIA